MQLYMHEDEDCIKRFGDHMLFSGSFLLLEVFLFLYTAGHGKLENYSKLYLI